MAGLLTGLKNLLFGKERPFLATVGIDLGTTHSGFAFCFNDNEGEDTIFVNPKWKSDLGYQTSKTPSCLLLKPDLTFDSFGYKAAERYAYVKDVFNTWKKFLFFEHLKISLDEGEILNPGQTSLEACNGKAVKATTVFAHCLRFLRDEAVNVVRQKSGNENYNVEDILWVLTVSVAWNPAAKQLMREAAYEAGLGSRDNPGQVIIAFDAEAAALFCSETIHCEAQTDNLALGELRESDCSPSEESNALSVIVDLGGSCLKVTVFEKSTDGVLHMSYNETVRPDDEVMVDCQFRTLLDQRFDTQKMCDYRKLFPTDWLKMMQGFEAKKCAFLKNETKIRMTGSFVSWLNDYRSPSMKCFAEGVAIVKIVDDKYLSVSSHAMRSLFQPLLDAIKDCLRDTVLKNPRSTTVFLVGGLSESPLLQKEIKNVFSGRFSDVITRGASIAVVHGAVILGKRAVAESRRVVSRTYGTDCSLRFVRRVHPEENKFTTSSGQERCKDLFNRFVKKNDIVKLGQKIAITYRPREANETEMRYSFYTADVQEVLLVTEPGVKKIGDLVLQSPDTLKGLDRDIEVSLHFIGTDVVASAWDVESGNMVQTTLDVFLPRVNMV